LFNFSTNTFDFSKFADLMNLVLHILSLLLNCVILQLNLAN